MKQQQLAANLKTTVPFTTTAAVKVKAILDTYTETEALDTVSDLTVASGKTAKRVVDFVKGVRSGEEADASIEISDGVVTLTFEGNCNKLQSSRNSTNKIRNM